MADATSPITQVVTTVADAANVDPLDLPPLYDSLDGDALNTLTQDSAVKGGASLTLTFRYAGFKVTVESENEDDIEVITTPVITMEDDGMSDTN